MTICDGPHQREPEPAARDAARALAAIELLPDVGNLILRDARPGIGHFHHHRGAVFKGPQFNRAARAGEFDGVIQQIVQGEEEQVRVTGHLGEGPGRLRKGEGKAPLGGFGGILGQAEDLLQQAGEIHRGTLQGARLQLRHFPQVRRQPAQAQGLCADALQGLPARFGGRRFGEVSQPGSNRRKRVFQFMIQTADETAAVRSGLRLQLRFELFRPVLNAGDGGEQDGEGNPYEEGQRAQVCAQIKRPARAAQKHHQVIENTGEK